MKASVVSQPGGPESIVTGEVPIPIPAEKELLVRVAATAVNRADTLQRQGKYPPPAGASTIMGLELAGVVESCGSGATRWKEGERIFGLLPGGGYAEYAVIHEDMAMRVPGGLSMEEAAAVPEVFLTAFQALRWLADLQAGETVLIHAAASGVGTAALQLVREMGGVSYSTASASKHALCIAHGARAVFDYRQGSWRDRVMAATGGAGVDVVIDFIAGPYFSDNLAVLRRDGRMVLLATLGGGKTEDVDLRQILAKRLSVMGSTLRSRSLEYQVRLTREFSDFALERFASGRLKPVIDTVLPLEQAAEAHRLIESNRNAGKIVLRV